MSTLNFNHSKTPENLRQLNQKLTEVIQSDDDSEQKYQAFQLLIRERDRMIRDHLSQLSDSEQKLFAESELTVNNQLNELAQSLLKSAKDDISRFIRSRAAIKKYE